MKGITIEERATELAHYIIDSKDTVRGGCETVWSQQVHSTHRKK